MPLSLFLLLCVCFFVKIKWYVAVFFHIKLCYLKNNCYICQRVSSTLRVGVRYKKSD